MRCDWHALEDAVAGAGAGDNRDGGTGADAQGVGVDVVDADQVSAEIGDYEVFI